MGRNNANNLDQYAGCLLGGAVGDALGAPLEFMNLPSIQQRFGSGGPDHYIQGTGSSGVFTDDTQMTLFSAEGVLRAYQRGMLKGIGGAEGAIMYQSYLRFAFSTGFSGWCSGSYQSPRRQ